MEPTNITKTITQYFSNNFERLQGAMPNERCFLVRGRELNEYSYAKPRIAIGTAIDILADTIEKKKFFGWFSSESIESVTNSGNSQIIPLNNGDNISGNFNVQLLKDGLFIASERVEPKKYLDILRTPEGFKRSADLFGIEGDLEKIASTIYHSK